VEFVVKKSFPGEACWNVQFFRPALYAPKIGGSGMTSGAFVRGGRENSG
jgi:hypothetical protein